MLDEGTLAFADFRGNRQYISMGNLSENARAFIFLMDYPNRRRVKIWGRAEFVEDDPDLLERLNDEDYEASPERVLVFHMEAWDVNCPQHITPRFTQQEIEPAVSKLRRRNEALQARVEELEARLADEPNTNSKTRPTSSC